MLLEHYKYDLINIACLPSSTLFNAMVEFAFDLSQVMPYLNAVVHNCSYQHNEKELSFMYEGHIVTMFPTSMRVTGVEDDNEARRLCDRIKELINRTWENRNHIKPVNECLRPVTPLDVMKFLPKTNCKLCSEPTCLAFALKVASSPTCLYLCPEMEKPEKCAEKRELFRLLKLDLHGREGT